MNEQASAPRKPNTYERIATATLVHAEHEATGNAGMRTHSVFFRYSNGLVCKYEAGSGKFIVVQED